MKQAEGGPIFFFLTQKNIYIFFPLSYDIFIPKAVQFTSLYERLLAHTPCVYRADGSTAVALAFNNALSDLVIRLPVVTTETLVTAR